MFVALGMFGTDRLRVLVTLSVPATVLTTGESMYDASRPVQGVSTRTMGLNPRDERMWAGSVLKDQ